MVIWNLDCPIGLRQKSGGNNSCSNKNVAYFQLFGRPAERVKGAM